MATEALNTSSWQFSIYAPDEKPVDLPASRPALVPDDIRPGPGNEQHKDGEPDILNAPLIKSDKVVTVQGDAIQSQWSETITGLMETVSNWSKVEAGNGR